MNQGPMLLNIFALIILIIISVVFFSKKRMHKIEDNLYSLLLIFAIFTIFSGVLLGSFLDIVFINKNILIVIFNKIYLIGLILTLSIFAYYTFCISHLYRAESKFHRIVYIIFCIFSVLLISILPINITEIDGNTFTSGFAIDITSLLFALIYFSLIIFTIIDFKNLKSKKYIPIILLIIEGIFITLIQIFYPSANYIINPSAVVTCLIMYFTIENPDMKLIEQLNIARDQAERANNAKSEFLSNMSHEIRTPLNAIVGFSQALSEEENVPDEAKDEIKDIMMASQNLLEIVNGILDISKIEANKLEIVNTEYSLKNVLEELTSLTKIRIGEKPITLRTLFDPSIPPVLYGDYVRLKQIVLNLLTNAAKYTKEGYIEFKVDSVIKDDVCRLIISVEDTGIGIKQESIDKLFNKFERLDVEKNITIEGTGLGLAITKKLVELMNGNIVVQSEYGNGSKFTVAIDQRIVEGKETTDTDMLSGEIELFDASAKSILVVDDNKINLKVAVRSLQKYKVQVDQVISGQECIDKIKQGQKYDLILLDDMMPKMSGIETLKELKKIDGFQMPTIAFTANAISGMKEKYLKDGFDDYLSKPIDKLELNHLLIKYLKEGEK